jgi:predicted Zn-dependent peptidase
LRDVPVPEAELADSKDGLVLSLPTDFSSVAGIAGRVAEQVVHALPDDWWTRYPAAVRAVTAADVQRVALRFLDPARLTTVMVGDPAVVRPQLEGLPIGDVEVRKP